MEVILVFVFFFQWYQKIAVITYFQFCKINK